jgi:hypothetical protein
VKPELLAEFRRVSRPDDPPAWALETSFILAPDPTPDNGQKAAQPIET